MIPTLRYALRKLAIVGLGKSGLSAARALSADGAKVLVWDDNPDARQKAAEAGYTVVEPNENSWSDVDRVIWSPGIPHTHPKPHPLAQLAARLGKPMVCDVDLLCDTNTQPFYVGITGTNGKSTTTALITHILKSAGQQAEAAGNIGIPALDSPTLGMTGTYVLELSSYQLELVPSLRLDVAVWTNITPDHLDRHGGMDGYVTAKRRLFQNQKYPSHAVIGVDDDYSARVCAELIRQGGSQVIPVSVTRAVENGVYVKDGMLIDATGRRPQEICDLREMKTLPGAHNWQNAALAYAASRCRGVSLPRILDALRSFPGLPHRQQLVAVIEDVAFINDSKATNADAASKALGCYTDVLWIAGGKAKEGGIASLAPLFPRIKHAFLIGESANDFAAVLKAANVPCTISGTLENAVEQADEMADHGDTVLLSPACASFDQFRSFEHRGEVFMDIVHELEEEDDDGDDGSAA
ncbi:UDP-N-acetylmuramoyl-L-alanine--D-glutamate ligase [Insolitispirillum peregrinum]|uniref:UDP-N-acetylmuramoyl-L-alanine--D-glutamate ligase n=1 Tax=Insolitispirillum peregrinum TaxID=80876 RepID=UPI00360FAA08